MDLKPIYMATVCNAIAVAADAAAKECQTESAADRFRQLSIGKLLELHASKSLYDSVMAGEEIKRRIAERDKSITELNAIIKHLTTPGAITDAKNIPSEDTTNTL